MGMNAQRDGDGRMMDRRRGGANVWRGRGKKEKKVGEDLGFSWGENWGGRKGGRMDRLWRECWTEQKNKQQETELSRFLSLSLSLFLQRPHKLHSCRLATQQLQVSKRL